MPIWLPAWKTLVNSASSSSRKQTKGCLLAVLPRKVTSLHPCPLAFSHPALPWGTQPLPSAVAVAVTGSRSRFGWSRDVHMRDPNAHPMGNWNKELPTRGKISFADAPAQLQKNHPILCRPRILRPPLVISSFTIFYNSTSA